MVSVAALLSQLSLVKGFDQPPLLLVTGAVQQVPRPSNNYDDNKAELIRKWGLTGVETVVETFDETE